MQTSKSSKSSNNSNNVEFSQIYLYSQVFTLTSLVFAIHLSILAHTKRKKCQENKF